MNNTALTLDQLSEVSGAGFFSDQFDLIVDYWLGDVIDDIKSNADKANKRYEEATSSVHGKPCTDRNLPVWY